MKTPTHIYMFQPRFAPMVEDGTKCNTIRLIRERMPKVGELADLRAWTGTAYRSAQRKLRMEVITGIESVTLDYSGVMLGGRQLRNLDQFAQADGFLDWPEMLHWFNQEHSLPFDGFITTWNPDK
jgi:hypothetical protein